MGIDSAGVIFGLCFKPLCGKAYDPRQKRPQARKIDLCRASVIADFAPRQRGLQSTCSLNDCQTGTVSSGERPVSNEALRRSIQGANAAAQGYIASGAAGSAARASASEMYSTRGIFSANEVYNPATGTLQRVDGSMNSYYQGPYGTVAVSCSYTVPNGTTQLYPRWP